MIQPQFTNNKITFGAMGMTLHTLTFHPSCITRIFSSCVILSGDSLYEYLLKLHLLSADPLSLRMYLESMRGMKQYLFQEASPAAQVLLLNTHVCSNMYIEYVL